MRNEPIVPLPKSNSVETEKSAKAETGVGLGELVYSPEGESLPRKVLLLTAQDFLLNEGVIEEMQGLEDDALGQRLQVEFQKNLQRHFVESGLAAEVQALAEREQVQSSDIPLDKQALALIAKKSEGTHGWIDMLPNLRQQKEGVGMNCTLASAMLHCALEMLGYSGVRTVLCKGHHVVFRESDDGSIHRYDPTSLTTVHNELIAYVRRFTPDQITALQVVDEGNGRRGHAISIVIDEADAIGGFDEVNQEGRYGKTFYAYDSNVKMDIGIALGNLSKIKEDIDLGEMQEEPSLNREAYGVALVEFMKQNNRHQLSEEAFETIALENKHGIEKLVQAATNALTTNSVAPNPFDYLQSDLLAPKKDLERIPIPERFVEVSERHQQANELCQQFPVLTELDFDTIKEKFTIFDGYEYL